MPAAGAAPDVATLKACEMVPPADVARTVGGTQLNEPPAGFPNCAYVLDISGATESYRLVFSDPGVCEALLDTQSVAEKGGALDGLWDVAHVQPRAAGGGDSVIAVRRGVIAVEVSGNRREPAVEIARLAVSRAG